MRKNTQNMKFMMLKVALGLALWPVFQQVSFAKEARVNGYFENATYIRDGVGLSKFRNTLQIEAEKSFKSTGSLSNMSVNGTFRVTYDGVYDLNEDDFGNQAGGAISLENTIEGPGSTVIFGEGLALPFTFDTANHPNEGMLVLGEHLHPTDGGVAFGVPVRPCDTDSRGCLNGYLDRDIDELRFQELNDRLDFIRELYFDFDLNLDNGNIISTRLGKQQVIWGRTDLFRVLDVINPVDYSRNNIYDELEDIRIPMWILKTDYRMGATETFDDLNLQLIWNFDRFRPNDLGQCGQPNVILDAGCFFRGMNTLWENGGTVANFAGGVVATDFGPGQIGIRQAEMPSWSLSNTQVGLKFEGVLGDLGFSLNALNYRSQMPSLRGGIPAQNSFTGEVAAWPALIAFDIHFPRVQLLGGSMDYYSQGIDTVFRLEAAHTSGEEFANTLKENLYSESNVLRYVIGVDKNIFIPLLNDSKAFLFSGQIFGQHILDHQREERLLGAAGIPDWEENWTATMLIKGWWMNDRLSPQLIVAHDVRAEATAIAMSVEWIFSDNLKLTGGVNFKLGTGARKFDDCRTCNPFSPFTAAFDEHDEGSTLGLQGFEPLGRFQSGPIGMAQKEDELQFSVRYSF
ncbi:DUF1302 family protein [Paraglaciecola arctica]|uniref:DUF1302 domain-containing protein n=1 Tax=Paraglaciecola arctica BSs20135 TaxID=493475 RepID=K6XDD1_9ALTE|nr:DUF1302 family protein [Paraglaciecola arctica]GAC18659.1 hypothetical protein GARC_1687 [Paraglaciecola arctica BSs20135]